MNLYFILEGEKTEVLLYPKWIKYILPHFSQVDFEHQSVQNNFYIFSGGGIPSIYSHTVNAIKNINDNPIFDKLIVCLDGEEIGVENRIKEIQNHINNSGIILNYNCKIEFVIQDVCIESWFLGNRKIVKKNPEGLELKKLMSHYNVLQEDPEKMENLPGYRNKAHLHISYFKEILKEHNLTYRKSKPDIVMDETFFKSLCKRITETNHLSTFKNLISLLEEINDLTQNKDKFND